MVKIQDLNIIFAGCAKNCEKYLPKVLENISHYIVNNLIFDGG